jgi:phosphoglycerol transferase MdoB-like AlkP superfamily enzyme
MILTLIIVTAIGVIWNAERSVEHLPLALASLCFSAAALLFVVNDLERAMLLSLMVAGAIHGASSIKYQHSWLKLMVTEFPLLLAGTVPFFVVQYPLAVAAVLAGSIALVGAAVAAVLYVPGTPVPFAIQVLLLGMASLGLFAAYQTSGGAVIFQQTATQPRCFFSTFVASLLDPHSWRQFGGLALSDIANEPLPLLAATPALTLDYPDIIVIQHESIFDPRLYGLPVDPMLEAFLSPKNGLHGCLNVDIFGGGSWQSEFSLLTGLSSASFGSNAYFLFERGVGCFHNSLPESLAALGYSTTLTSSCRRNFLNYDNFYRSIGMKQRIFTDDLPPPFDVEQFEATNSDTLFLAAALGTHSRATANDAAPRFLYALTNFNHGPHSRRLAAPENFESARAFAAASLADASYVEYYARLTETVVAWNKLKAAIETQLPKRPTLVVHYGDHQPVMARRIQTKLKLPIDARRQFRTFYAIEMLNGRGNQPAIGRGPNLDIAFLGTLALQQAGLPLDPVFATRASLLEQCGETYFASTSERKRRFHRTLVDLGLIDVAPAAQH